MKVVKRYKDKYTNLLHEIGETLEVNKGRFGEINSTALGVFVEEIKTEKKSTKK